jgi:hypothetical protein
MGLRRLAELNCACPSIDFKIGDDGIQCLGFALPWKRLKLGQLDHEAAQD